MKKTDKLTKAQIKTIPELINDCGCSVGEIARRWKVSWQAVWYWVKRLKENGVEINTKSKGQVKMKL